MNRTTISLPDDLASVLRREARRRDTSVSQVARKALEEHLGVAPDEPRLLAFAAIGASGHRTTAREMEELLEREWDELPRGR